MNALSLIKDFYSTARDKQFPVAVRMTYFTLFGEFNERFWREEEIAFSLRELAELSGVSKSAVGEAIIYLADRGYIKTYRPRRLKEKTIIKMLFPDTKGTQGGISADSRRTQRGQNPDDPGANNFIEKRCGLREDQIRPVRPERPKDRKTGASASANSPKEEKNKGVETLAGDEIAGIDNRILHEWRVNVGEPGGAECEGLHRLQGLHGVEKVVAGIRTAALSAHAGFSFNYVKKVIEGNSNARNLYGDGREKENGGVTSGDYRNDPADEERRRREQEERLFAQIPGLRERYERKLAEQGT